MAEITEERFLQAYGNLILSYWALPEFKARLESNPADVLKEAGLDSGGTPVTLLRPGDPPPAGVANRLTSTAPTADSAYAMWIAGKAAGTIPFYIPEVPPDGVGSGPLSDDELMAVAGGAGDTCCCCCCPCCSC